MESCLFNFRIDSTAVLLTVGDKSVEWRPADNNKGIFSFLKKNTTKAVLLNFVLGIKKSSSGKALQINFIEQVQENKLALHDEIFQGTPDDCENCIALLETRIKQASSSRPQSLFIFVNPVSGLKSGRKIYDQHVAPVFEMAGIKTETIVTSRGGQVCEDLQTLPLHNYDGLVIVGGDGTFTEACNGLVRRAAKDQSIDINDPASTFPQITTKIGIIPAGTGQGMVQGATKGSKDLMTAILLIILGNSHPINLCSVYHESKLALVGSMLACYGLFGNLIRDSERNRTMPGGLRYLYAMGKNFIEYESVSVKLEYLPQKESAEATKAASSTEWLCKEGSYKSINMFLMDFVNCTDATTLWQPQEFMTLYLVPDEVNRTQHLKFLLNMMTKKDAKNLHQSVDRLPVLAYKVHIVDFSKDRPGKEPVLDVDGEALVLNSPDYEMWFRKHAIEMFLV